MRRRTGTAERVTSRTAVNAGSDAAALGVGEAAGAAASGGASEHPARASARNAAASGRRTG